MEHLHFFNFYSYPVAPYPYGGFFVSNNDLLWFMFFIVIIAIVAKK
jgi:hypothetical protein